MVDGVFNYHMHKDTMPLAGTENFVRTCAFSKEETKNAQNDRYNHGHSLDNCR